MQKTWSLVLLMVLTGTFAFLTQTAQAQPKFKLKGQWKLIKRTRNIKVYQMKVRGSRLIAMRGDATFHAPITKVISLLSNEQDKIKWVDRLKEVRMIHQTSPLDYIAYMRFKLPWPASPRDFVTRTQVFIYPKEQKIVRYRYSVTHPKAPKRKGVVRAAMHFSRYVLKSIDGGKKTWMRAEGYGDPKGSIPAFIINMIQRRWPYKSMKNIKKYLKKGTIKEDPYFSKALKKKE
jgi:hypothetical protein